MKLWKGVVLLVIILVLGVGCFFAYRAIANRHDLKETLLWIDQTYNPHEGADNLGQGHGWEIHYLKKGDVEEITEKFNTTVTLDGDCNVVTRSETFPVGVYSELPSVTTYKFNLSDIDPSSITIKTYDLHKDACQFVCGNEPDGMKADQLDGKPLFSINGTQTLSHGYLVMLDMLPQLQQAGVTHFRLSPQLVDMVRVAALHRAVLDGSVDTKEALASLREDIKAPLVNGYVHGRAGMTYVEEGVA